MAISKRLRYEILRRDDYRCQYCGSTAKDATLQVDHLVPVTLGGSDDPGNLVAACKDCNAGKSSIPADAPLAKKVSEQSAAYALALTDKMTKIRGRLEEERLFIEQFEDAWNGWHRVSTGEVIELPSDWKTSLRRWFHMGVPMELLEYAIEVAMTKQGLRTDYGEFKYMAGVTWRQLDAEDTPYELSEKTVATYTALDVEYQLEQAREDAWRHGYSFGYQKSEEKHGTR